MTAEICEKIARNSKRLPSGRRVIPVSTPKKL